MRGAEHLDLTAIDGIDRTLTDMTRQLTHDFRVTQTILFESRQRNIDSDNADKLPSPWTIRRMRKHGTSGCRHETQSTEVLIKSTPDDPLLILYQLTSEETDVRQQLFQDILTRYEPTPVLFSEWTGQRSTYVECACVFRCVNRQCVEEVGNLRLLQ